MDRATFRNGTKAFALFFTMFLFLRCSTDLTECGGPQLNISDLKTIKKTFFSNGPRAFLVVPNPIDATQVTNIQSSDPLLSKELDAFSLPNLLSPQRLENSFVKIRIQSTTDDPSILAAPNSNGVYQFPINDVHYSETMAYYSINAVQKYVEALGFSVVKSRPLYVLVRAKDESGNSSSVNALYNHNFLNPSLPRYMRLYGDGPYAPGIDREMYSHEFGHLFNESVSNEVGIDFAGDNGAVFTEASALHECLADYLSESIGDKGNIGKWIARNFPEYAPGQPLRSAEPLNDDFNDFKNVSINDGTGKNPERYRMAEWCSRVLWDIRGRIVKEDKEYGSIFADRLIFSAASLLKRDTSMSQFKAAIQTADEKLHCGFHSRSIQAAFDSRGFVSNPPTLNSPLNIQASPLGFTFNANGEASIGNPAPGGEVTFILKIKNPNSETARNVQVLFESGSSLLVPTTYMQSYADMPGGMSLMIGDGGLGIEYSLFGTIDKSTRSGSRLPYKIRIKTENGPETSIQGEVAL